MDALKVLLERRSIRKYRAVNVSDEVLQEIVEAGLYAPSGLNLQPWYFVVVRTPEKMTQVRAVMSVVALTQSWKSSSMITRKLSQRRTIFW